MTASSVFSAPRAIAVLTGIALACAVVVSATYQFTDDRIAANHDAFLAQQFSPVLNLANVDRITINNPIEFPPDPQTPGGATVSVYAAISNDRVAALVFRTRVIGYSGPIELLVGIAPNLSVSGVRVISHNETPGLGDKIERRKSDWVEDFKNQTLSGDNGIWALRRAGGIFDEFTGASVTPRAVVRGVKETLQFASPRYQDLVTQFEQ